MNTTTLILFALGFAGLMLGGELLVRGASRLAAAAGIPLSATWAPDFLESYATRVFDLS